MYSQNTFYPTKLIENIYIIGLSNIDLDHLNPLTSSSQPTTTSTSPEILFTFNTHLPKATPPPNFLPFAFPNGLSLSLTYLPPTTYSIVLTNEKGIRSYLHILLLYDKITLTDNDITNSLSSSPPKHFYCPIGICISTYHSNFSFFRNILNEIYRIIHFDTSLTSTSNITSTSTTIIDDTIINCFQKMELLYIFNNLCYILSPPSLSSLTITTHFNSISFITESQTTIPSNDYCIKLLLQCLDIDTIITLYTALLFEKHIIIISNSNTTLFCICEALITLLFPFRWLHSYITNLPSEQLDYLESPTPYLMGIMCGLIEPCDIVKQFPSHVVCDVTISKVYGATAHAQLLPSHEERRLRSELLRLRNKNVDTYDNVDYYYDKCCNRCDSVSRSKQRTLGEKVQDVFFAVYKDKMKLIKQECVVNNVFIAQKFLSLIHNEEEKEFYGKVIRTLAFEFFIMSMQYMDDSLERRFYNVVGCKKKKKNEYIYDMNVGYYYYEIKLYPINVGNEFRESYGDEGGDNVVKNYNEVVTCLDGCKRFMNKNGGGLQVNPFCSCVSRENESRGTNSCSNNNNSIVCCGGSSSNNNVQMLSFYQQNGFLSFIVKYYSGNNNDVGVFSENTFLSPEKEIKQQILSLYNTYVSNNSNNNNNSSNNVLSLSKTNYLTLTPDSSFQYLSILTLYLSFFALIPSTKLLSLYNTLYELNRTEFQRNLLYTQLTLFSHSSLKSSLTLPSLSKFISKTLTYLIRKIEKVKYKTLVISQETSDDDEYDNEQPRLSTSTTTTTKQRMKRQMTTRLNNVKCTLLTIPKKQSHQISLCDIPTTTTSHIPLSSSALYNISHSYDKDPIALIEQICILLYDILLQCNIHNKINSTVAFDMNVYRDVSKHNKFTEVKDLILMLDKISLLKVTANESCYYCFWLNAFNFLSIFALIYKCECMTNYFEWYRFLKNSYYSIGGIEISLIEIENLILRKDDITQRIYGEKIKNEIQKLPRLTINNKWVNYGIYLPNVSSVNLQIYFPNTLNKSLKANASEFICKHMKINVNIKEIVLPEYVVWIENDFVKNLWFYKEILPHEVTNWIDMNRNDITVKVDKYIWKVSFELIKQ